jgi:hypothetical protein
VRGSPPSPGRAGRQVFRFARTPRLPGVAPQRAGAVRPVGLETWRIWRVWSPSSVRHDVGQKKGEMAPAEPTAEAVNAAGVNCYQRITAERALHGSPTYAAS